MRNHIFFNIIFPLFFLIPVLHAGKKESSDSAFEKIHPLEKQLTEKTRKKAIATLAKFAKKRRESNLKHRASALLGSEYRKEKKFKKAFSLLSAYSDYDKISKTSSFPFRSGYLHSFLELAHCKAVNPDSPKVTDALKMLAYAEERTDGMEKCCSLFKFAEILYDLSSAGNIDNLNRAENYCNACLQFGDNFFKPVKTSATGKTKTASGAAEWSYLRSKAEGLLLEINIAILAAEYGEGYANYVKMRILYDKKDSPAAFSVAEELTTIGKNSIFGEAGRLYYCRILILNDRTEIFEDRSLPSGVKEIKKFIEESPSGPFTGEAILELAEYAIRNGDGNQASHYYKKALKWFRETRKTKDAIDLYSLSPKLKNVSAPQGELSSLDEWNRTVYRKPKPKEIITPQTAPWSINENERECLFMVGFFLFQEGEFEKAKACFKQAKTVSRDLAALDAKRIPNALWRLESACNVERMIFTFEEKKCLKGKNKLLCSYAELNYLLEKFDTAIIFFKQIADSPKSTAGEKAVAFIGLGISHGMIKGRREKAFKNLRKAYSLTNKSSLRSEALIRLACMYQGSTKTAKESIRYFKEYIAKFPDGKDKGKAMFRLALAYRNLNKRKQAENWLGKLKKSCPDSAYTKQLEQLLKQQ